MTTSTTLPDGSLHIDAAEYVHTATMVRPHYAGGAMNMTIPAAIVEAKRALDAGEIDKAEVARRIAAVNTEIRARGIPHEARKPAAKVNPNRKAKPKAPADAAKKRALEGAAARLKKHGGTVGVTQSGRTELEDQLTGVARKNAELLAKLKSA